jgi:lipopolysaccharide export system permease protein
VPILLRYVLKELLFPLVGWLAFLFLLLFVMQFLRATEVLLGSAVTAADLGWLLVYLAPHFVVMALPVAFLLAILLGLGRLGEDRELTAMAALGIGPVQVTAVPVILGIGLGALTWGLSATVEPRGLSGVRGLVNEVIKKNIVGDVKPGVFYEDLTHLTVYAERVDADEGRWANVLIHDDREPASPLLVLAHEGRVNPSGQGEALKLALADGEVHRAQRAGRDYAIVAFERAEINVGVADRLVSKNRFRSPREELTPAELLEAARFEASEGRPKAPFLMAFWSRVGNAFTPVAFALLGTPLALSRRGAGRARGLLLTIVGYVGFYVLSRMFENMGSQGRLPLLPAALLPALIVSAVGLVSLWRVVRAGTSR